MLDWHNKVVALGTDGAAVNLGSKEGVAAKLHHEISHLVTVRIHLCKCDDAIIKCVNGHSITRASGSCKLLALWGQYTVGSINHWPHKASSPKCLMLTPESPLA